MKLHIEFDMDMIDVPSRDVYEALRCHFDKIIKQINRYPEGFRKPNLGYSFGACDTAEPDKSADIEARWWLTDDKA